MNGTVLIMAGGTGGHIFPALEVASLLAGRGWRIVWLGTPRGLENRLVPEAGYPLRLLSMAGVRRRGVLEWALMPTRLLLAFAQALRILRAERPALVLGMGGYPSVPGGLMAALMGRPLVIHEQNSVAGLANRLLAGVADRVLAAFDGAFSRGRLAWWRPPQVEVTGNPVRADILALPEPELRLARRQGPLRLLVLGGSLGAAALNETVPVAMALLPASARPQVTHQAGAGKAEATRSAYQRQGVVADVPDFVQDMAAAYAAADLVLCRAGALTVAELAAAGVPALFVPYPHAVDDHQTGNARAMVDAGAALLLPQEELDARRLADLIAGLDRATLLDMACRARAFGRPEAARRLADICEELAA